jgi:hypothetical protein
MTSLLDIKNYSNNIFKSLCYKRWSVEIFYDESTNKLKEKHFSGYSRQSILQNFHTALFILNIQTMIVRELEYEIVEKTNKEESLLSVKRFFLPHYFVTKRFYLGTFCRNLFQILYKLFYQYFFPSLF